MRHPRRWAALAGALAVAATVTVWWAAHGGGVDLGNDGYVGSPVWAADGRIYYIAWFHGDSDAWGGELWRTLPDGQPEPVPVTVLDCSDPLVMDDLAIGGDVGLMVDCNDDRHDTRLVRYRVAQQTVQVLAAIPDELWAAAWRDDDSSGYAAANDDCSEGLVAFPTTAHDLLLANAAGTCFWRGPASAPQLALADTRLVFMATVGCQQVQPSNHPVDDVHDWSLCVMDLTTHGIGQIVNGFTDEPEVWVDPALRRAVVVGQRSGRYGVWLVDFQSRAVSLLIDGDQASVGFALDGRSLAVIANGTLTTRHLP